MDIPKLQTGLFREVDYFFYMGLYPKKGGVPQIFPSFLKEMVTRTIKKIFRQKVVEIKLCTRLSLCFFALNIAAFA